MVRTLVIGQRWSLNRQLKGRKRRRESNPLETALQTVAWPSGSSVVMSSSAPARSRTWSSTFAESRASATLRGHRFANCNRVFRNHARGSERTSAPPRNRTSSCSFEGCRASGTLAGQITQISRPGLEPGHRRDARWSWTFGGSNAIRYTIGNQGRPLDDEASGTAAAIVQIQADDWIRTSMIRFTGPAPFSVEPRRQKHRCKESNPVRLLWRQPALPGAHR